MSAAPYQARTLDELESLAPHDDFIWTREPGSAAPMKAYWHADDLPRDGRECYEWIDQNKPHRPFFDLDPSQEALTEARLSPDEFVTVAVAACAAAILAVDPLYKNHADAHAVTAVRDSMVVTYQGDATKASMHIVGTLYSVDNHEHMRAIAEAADRVLAADYPALAGAIDLGVYRSRGALRMVHASKGRDAAGNLIRQKTPYRHNARREFEEFLVANGSGDRLAWPEGAQPKEPAAQADAPEGIPANIMVAAEANGLAVRAAAAGNAVAFDRVRPAFCNSCQREHTNDGAYAVSDAETGVVSLICRRAARGAPALASVGTRPQAAAPVNLEPEASPFDDTYSARRCRPFGKGDVAVKSAWGTGKTYQYIELAKGVATVLVVSSRVALSASICARGGFTSYKDVRGQLDIREHPKVVCQYESLKRLFRLGQVPQFDVVIIDEPVGLRAHVIGNQCDRAARSFAIMCEAIRKTKQTVVTDNDLDPDELAWLRQMRPGLRAVANDFRCDEGRRLTMLSAPTSRKALAAIEHHVLSWFDGRAAGGKATLAVSIKRDAKALAAALAERGVKTLLVTGDTPAREKARIFADVIAAMEAFDVLVHTSSIDRGVDVDDARFDTAFGLFSNHVTTAEDAAQMVHRARQARQYVVAYQSSAGRERSRADILELVRGNNGRMERMAAWHDEPPHLMDMLEGIGGPNVSLEDALASPLGQFFVDETRCRMASKANARARFVAIMVRMGCVLEEIDGDERATWHIATLKKKIAREEAEALAAADMPPEDCMDADAVDVWSRGDLSPAEELAVKKYYLLRRYGLVNSVRDGAFEPTADFVETYGPPAVQEAYRATQAWVRWSRAAGTQEPGAVIRAPARGWLAGPDANVRALAVTTHFDRHADAQRLLQAAGFTLGSAEAVQKADVLARLATPESAALCTEVAERLPTTFNKAVCAARLRARLDTPAGRLGLVKAVLQAQYAVTLRAADRRTRAGRGGLSLAPMWGEGLPVTHP